MKTRLSALAAAVSSLSMLTACGGGGGASGEVPEYTPPYIPSWTTAEGMWEGAMGSGRSISGVVTSNKESWLVYSTIADPLAPAGFYYGSGTFDTITDTQGLYAPQAPGEREFNFEGGGAKAGGLAANYDITDGYTSANELNGDLQVFSAAGIYDVEMSATVFFPTANGNLIMTGFTGTWNSNTNQGFWHGTSSIPGFETTLWYDQTFTMNEDTGTGNLNTLFNCAANTVSACTGFSGALQGNFRNTQGTGNPVNNNSYKKAYAFTPADGLTLQWTLQVFKPTGQTDINGDPIVDYTPMPTTVTLHTLTSLPSLTADTFETNYDDLYEETPTLATVAGSYTASPAYTGVGSAISTNTTTFSISSEGAITGSDTTSHCVYSGTIAPRANGNVYNVTALTFTNDGVGSCAYTSSGAFTGVATYDAGKLTLTAKNAGATQGFLVVVSKP